MTTGAHATGAAATGSVTSTSTTTRPWSLAGTEIPVKRSGLTLTAESITLSFDVDADNLGTWRAIGDRAGRLDTETGFGGAFQTFARGSDGTVTVTPASVSSPPFAFGSFFVSSYRESHYAPKKTVVEFELARQTNRRDEFSGISATDVQTAPGAPTLTLGLRDGSGLSLEFGPDQVGQLSRDGSPAGPSIEVPLLVSPAQAAAVADAAGFPGGVVERAVPDGDSIIVDESGGRQTAVVSAADDVPLADGDYAIAGWTIERYRFDERRRFRLALTLRPL